MKTGLSLARSLRLLVLLLIPAVTVAVPNGALAEVHDASQFYLVGVGPGDPDLITMRALRVIREADVIVCTNAPENAKQELAAYFAFEKKFERDIQGKELVHTDWFLTRYYGEDAAIYEGEKLREYQEVTRKRNRVIAKLRRAIEEGKTVAVLSKGDPLIYGPHAWYLEEFADLDPVVVPGVSSFNAANAALKTSVTSGRGTNSVILTAGYESPDRSDTIEELSAHRCTMVLFTMGTQLPACIRRLRANYPAETPVAIVIHAGYKGKQGVIRGTLGSILDVIGDRELPFEHLIYVGDFLSCGRKGADSG